MSSDVEIRIFGKVSDPEAIWELANDAAAEGRTVWLYSFAVGEFGEACSSRPNVKDVPSPLQGRHH